MKTSKQGKTENGTESKEKNNQHSIYAYIYLSTRLSICSIPGSIFLVSNCPQLEISLEILLCHDLFPDGE